MEINTFIDVMVDACPESKVEHFTNVFRKRFNLTAADTLNNSRSLLSFLVGISNRTTEEGLRVLPGLHKALCYLSSQGIITRNIQVTDRVTSFENNYHPFTSTNAQAATDRKSKQRKEQKRKMWWKEKLYNIEKFFWDNTIGRLDPIERERIEDAKELEEIREQKRTQAEKKRQRDIERKEVI